MAETPKRILLVDDEEGIIDILRINLESEGYEISMAGDGVAALEAVHSNNPDLIVLDVMMPFMDGWEVLRRLESDTETAGTPVIMLSVCAGEEDIVRGLEQGAVEYLTKPFDPIEVVQVVRSIVENLDIRGRQTYRMQLMDRRRRSMKPLHQLFSSVEG
jgi:DNA-binding response OmpR family regulator